MEEYLNVRKAALYAGVSESTIRRWRKSRGLPSYKIGDIVLIKQIDLDEWLEKYRRVDRLARSVPKNALTPALPSAIDNAKGGKSKMAFKKGQTCFNYGFGRVYVRTYESGRICWTIEYRDENGKRKQKACPDVKSKEEAVFTLQKEVAEAFDRKHRIRRRGKIGFKNFAQSFLEDYMMTTRRNFQSDVYRLRQLCSYFKETDLRNITPLTIERFKKERRKKGNTKATTNRYLALMKRMFNVAIQEGYAEENPVQKVKLYSEKDTLKERILTEDEEMKLLESCSETLRPIVAVALNTGMRRAEILNLQRSQIDLKARTIRVEKTKSGKVRYIPMNDVLFNKLCKLSHGQSPFVFFNPETGKPYIDMKKGFKAACHRAGIEGMRFHDLRHTFASRLVEKGVDIETIRELCGHSSITVTQRYTHSSDERKRAAVELLSSKVEGKICAVFVTQENQSKLIH